MAIKEVDVILTNIDEDGNETVAHPFTKFENILNLELATTTTAGLMSASDKTTLNSVVSELNGINVLADTLVQESE